MSEQDNGWLEQFTTLGWRHSEALRTLKASGRQGSRDIAPETLASIRRNEFRPSKAEVSSLRGTVSFFSLVINGVVLEPFLVCSGATDQGIRAQIALLRSLSKL